jgi:bifunctional non-homologous end joining protein LigD
MARARTAIEIDGVRITSPERVLYEGQGITKRELAEYHASVADHLLPQLKGRLLTLIRCPSGRAKECFVQRRAGGGIPASVTRVEVEEGGGTATYLAVGSRKALLSLAQLGTLELHTWSSRTDRLDRPDRMILDLDPAPDLPFSAVVEAAREIRERLAEAGLECFVKTTGGKGLHLVAPLVRRSTFEEVRAFARALAEELERRAPERYLSDASKAERGGRIYVDYLRNAWAASAVAAYSPRARPGATVSTPLSWEELTPSLDPREHTVRTVPARLASGKAPWARYGEVSQALTAAARESLQR